MKRVCSGFFQLLDAECLSLSNPDSVPLLPDAPVLEWLIKYTVLGVAVASFCSGAARSGDLQVGLQAPQTPACTRARVVLGTETLAQSRALCLPTIVTLCCCLGPDQLLFSLRCLFANKQCFVPMSLLKGTSGVSGDWIRGNLRVPDGSFA